MEHAQPTREIQSSAVAQLSFQGWSEQVPGMQGDAAADHHQLEGQSNSVVVDAARQVESRCQSLAEWEVTPGGNVERTDDASGVLHGTAAPDADSGYGRLRLGEQALAQALEGIEQLLCVGRAWRRDAGGGEELASCIDNGRAQLGAANVDRQDGRIRHGVAPQGARRGSYPDCDPREC